MNASTVNIGGKLLDLSRPRVMAIINMTPDSFYEGSRNFSDADILAKAEKALGEGAAILDLGGYSSRPDAQDVSPQEEFERLDLAFGAIRREFPEAPISVDTFRSEIVRRLFDRYGSFLINDISSGELDPAMIPLAGELGLPYLGMHMRGTPKTMQTLTEYEDITLEVLRYFVDKIAMAQRHGIKDFIVDPGFGFAKTTAQNFELLARLSDFKILDMPLLVGISRKSMICRTLGITPPEALNATSALHWEALRAGADILRVHDVKEAEEVIKLFCTFMLNAPEKIKREAAGSI